MPGERLLKLAALLDRTGLALERQAALIGEHVLDAEDLTEATLRIAESVHTAAERIREGAYDD